MSKYPIDGEILSLDENYRPVMGGMTETGEIRQLRVSEGGSLLVVTNNNPSSTGALVCGQTKITTTGTEVNLPANDVGQFVVVKAFSSNIGNITVGVTGVTNTVNGSGNGFILEPGDMLPIVVDNSNKIFINGTANDIVSYSLT